MRIPCAEAGATTPFPAWEEPTSSRAEQVTILFAAARATISFFFGSGFGKDTIADWQDGPWFLAQDYISFKGMGLSMADLSITYSGGNAIVSVGALHGVITILSAPVGSIGADDFLF